MTLGSNVFQQMMAQMAAPAAPVASKAKAIKAKTAPAVRTDTKRARAVDLYKTNIAAGKAAVITLFKTELAMTDAGANSYFYATKKLCK